LLDSAKVELLGKPLPELRRWARREALQAAHEYTSQWVSIPAIDPAAAANWFVSGHQPTLYHPGVWVKNFFVGEYARRTGGIGLNLVVDNDLCGSSSLRVPVGTRREPRIESIAFDAPRAPLPWEETRILDRSLFESFSERVGAALAPWHVVPLLKDLWPAVTRFSERSSRIADCFTAARNQCERRWGCANLELPLSRVCEREPFLWFAVHMLANASRFREVHNRSLVEFRKANRIRSRNHPVPELREENGACEVPFWMWREGESRRHRVFVARLGEELELSDGGRQVFARIPLSQDQEPAEAITALRNLAVAGIRLRTRALSTTLFARLCLADLFLHGIGGAIYDEMTDRICERFYGVQPPGYLTVSATLHLPLGNWDAAAGDDIRLRSRLRELEFHAEQHLPEEAAGAASDLLAEKRRLIEEQQAVTMARREGIRSAGDGTPGIERYQALKAVNRKLAEHVGPKRERLLAELAETERQQAVNALLCDREYSLGLFPAEKLQSYLERIRRFSL
jgi:hypothetical protein